jgi:DtxR family Mn-dependent transcriptional regulator
MNDLVDTGEMYLKTIYECVEEGIPPLRARIAERLKQSGPTVSETVARLERDGLVVLHPDRHLELSPKGMRLAKQVMRRHRLVERLLTDVIGLDWPLVHDEACRWEHVVSEDVERRLLVVLDNPTESPYGNPIPALDELGVSEPPPEFMDGVRQLAALLSGGQARDVVARRIGEAIQKENELLICLDAVGFTPGSELRAELGGGQLTLTNGEKRVCLPEACALGLFVAVP